MHQDGALVSCLLARDLALLEYHSNPKVSSVKALGVTFLPVSGAWPLMPGKSHCRCGVSVAGGVGSQGEAGPHAVPAHGDILPPT